MEYEIKNECHSKNKGLKKNYSFISYEIIKNITIFSKNVVLLII